MGGRYLPLTLLSRCTHPYLDPYSDEFRFDGAGLASHKEAKIGEHNRLGKAFCRWFLHEHCDVTYFAHLDEVLGRGPLPACPQFRIERCERGDTPDYLCAGAASGPYLAEAKGTGKAVSFTSAKFAGWRRQFGRVAMIDTQGQTYSVKGYLVATRMVAASKPQANSALLAEDPRSAGERPIEDIDGTAQLRSAIAARHYADIFTKLGQPLLATALQLGIPLPQSIVPTASLWRCLVPPAQGREFIGGFFAPPEQWPTFHYDAVGHLHARKWNLAANNIPFFGLERGVARSLEAIARRRDGLAYSVVESFFEGQRPWDLSALRDGSAFDPLDYFAYEGEVAI